LAYRISLFPYTGRPAQAVRRLKYSRCTSLAGFMADEVAEAVSRFGLDPDLVVPVPIHWSRRCMRGFNQADLLCEGLDSVPQALRRVRRTRPQVGLTDAERRTNLVGAFRATAIVKGQRVLLIDDVLTSGQTARECARALFGAGATEVGVLAFCGEE
jgi:ComF family protein